MVSDGNDEADEFVEFEFYSLVSASFDQVTPWVRVIGWILDDDGTSQNRAIGVTSPIVVEDDGGRRTANFTISLSRPVDQDISLTYATRNGTAVARQDYVTTSGQVTFLAGQTVATVTVPILGDLVLEDRETFDLVVTPTAEFSSAGFGHIGTAAILDDDSGDLRPVVLIESQDVGESYFDGIYFVL